MPSLHSRERGLKFCKHVIFRVILLSLHSRERGLKFVFKYDIIDILKVAPLAGAWIEIIL